MKWIYEVKKVSADSNGKVLPFVVTGDLMVKQASRCEPWPQKTFTYSGLYVWMLGMPCLWITNRPRKGGFTPQEAFECMSLPLAAPSFPECFQESRVRAAAVAPRVGGANNVANTLL